MFRMGCCRWVPFDVTSPSEWRAWSSTHTRTLAVYGLGGLAAVAAAGYLLAFAGGRNRRS